MAETADILANAPDKQGRLPTDEDRVHVILPDLGAGCSMADMAPMQDVEDAWEDLERPGASWYN